MKRKGKGSYYYKNGDSFEGDWVSDKRSGKGKLIMKDGSIYTGEFMNDMAEGNGVFTDANKNIFKSSKNNQGYFKNGRL